MPPVPSPACSSSLPIDYYTRKGSISMYNWYVHTYLTAYTEYSVTISIETPGRPQARWWTHILQGMEELNLLGISGYVYYEHSFVRL